MKRSAICQYLKRNRRFLMKRVAIVGSLCVLALGVVLAWPMDTRRYLEAPASPQMLDRKGRLLHALLNANQEWCFPVPLEAVSPRLIDATLAAEDQRFYRHCGVDIWAVGRAFWQTVRHGRIHSGASTISMQVIKLGEGRSGRASLSGKLRQAVQAIRLELRAGKKEILQAYLNLAPYHGNTRGCEAAAWRFFGKPALELTLPEAVLLSGLPKAPSALNPIRHPDRATRRWHYVAARMQADGLANPADLVGSALRLPRAIYPFPRHAPHFALRHKAELRREKTIRSTFDFEIQHGLEAFLIQSAKRMRASSAGQITNCAAVVLDAPSASVLGWVGSGDFRNTPGGGQFDAARAIRPPGSTLKPFLYAFAMQQSLLYPSEVLLDAPMDSGLYNPRNFDEIYRGYVRSDDALRDSLNIPALSLLGRVGIENFHHALKPFGFRHMNQPSEHYGLGLILGNSGAELAELAEAYAVFANQGLHSTLQWRKGAPRRNRRLLSPDIAMQINSILRQPLIDSGFANDRFQRLPLHASWKTGTSSGRHDAWAVLYNRRYVVAVWVGNNDYSPCESLVGSRAALPLATRIFRDLPRREKEDCRPAPEAFHPVRVCTATGLPAGRHCRATHAMMLPVSIHTLRSCDVHHATSESWPADPLGWDLASTPRQSGSPRRKSNQGATLQILQPARDAQFVKTGSVYGDRILLQSSLDGREPLHWYLGGQYIGTTTDQPLHLDLTSGEHHLSVLSGDGRSDSVRFSVIGHVPGRAADSMGEQ